MSAHRYWRVNVSATNGADIEIADLELRTSAGGADQTVPGGTIAANNNYFGNPPSLAIDAYTAGEGAWSTPGTGWLRYDFGVGVTKDIVEVAIAIDLSVNGGAKNFTVESSDDATTWTTVMTLTNITGWSQGQRRTFQSSGEVTTPTPGSAARMWRLVVTANNGATLSYNELEFRDSSGTDQTSPGTVGSNIFGSICVAGASADKLFDDNLTTACTLPNNTAGWYAYDLGSGVSSAITVVAITSGSSTTGTPKDFKLQKSDDGYGWTTVWSLTGITGWSANQTRAFNSSGEVLGVTLSLTGVSATGSSHSFGGVAHAQALTGVAATGGTGAVKAAGVLALTRVAATGSVGAVTPTQGLRGVTATGSAGSLAYRLSKALSQVSASGSVGTVTYTITTLVPITGVAAVGSVHGVGSARTIGLTRVSAAGTAGAVVVTRAVALHQVAASVHVGTVAALHTVGLTQVHATGDTGTPLAGHGAALSQVHASGSPGNIATQRTMALTHVSASGYVGSMGPPRGLVGNVATGRAGNVGVNFIIALRGNAATGGVGAAKPAYMPALTGNSATGSVGSVGIRHTVVLAQASAIGTAHSLMPAQGLRGNAAPARVGNLGVRLASPLTGVAATGSANRVQDVKPAPPKTAAFITGPAALPQISTPVVTAYVRQTPTVVTFSTRAANVSIVTVNASVTISTPVPRREPLDP